MRAGVGAAGEGAGRVGTLYVVQNYSHVRLYAPSVGLNRLGCSCKWNLFD